MLKATATSHHSPYVPPQLPAVQQHSPSQSAFPRPISAFRAPILHWTVICTGSRHVGVQSQSNTIKGIKLCWCWFLFLLLLTSHHHTTHTLYCVSMPTSIHLPYSCTPMRSKASSIIVVDFVVVVVVWLASECKHANVKTYGACTPLWEANQQDKAVSATMNEGSAKEL